MNPWRDRLSAFHCAAHCCGWRIEFLTIQLLVVFLAGCSDSVTERYATIEDARKAGLFQRGWLPDVFHRRPVTSRQETIWTSMYQLASSS